MRLIIGLAALFALTACGAEAAPQTAKAPEVASLATTGSGATSAAAGPPQDERPRERIDDTPEQNKKLHEPYRNCMIENGIPLPGDRKENALTSEQYAEIQPKAWEKCKSKFPLRPWEFDKNNPESMDYIHRVVECLRRNGATVEERPAGPGDTENSYAYVGPNNEHLTGVPGMELSAKCQRESAQK